MKKGIIGKKLGMTQIFDEMGNVIPVTVIEAGPCVVVQKKTVEMTAMMQYSLASKTSKKESFPSPLRATRLRQEQQRDISRNSNLMMQRL